MDDNQQQTILRSIAISSGFLNATNPGDLQVAYQVLESFKKYNGRINLCVGWLHQDHLALGETDVTIPAKLYALTIIDTFLDSSYSKLMENERLELRHAVLIAARQIAPAPIVHEARILGNKLASIIAALMVRDFPQRWTTFFVDVFSPMRQGGLWCNEGGSGMHTMGVKICLSCLRLVTEDTTDSDFNAKVRFPRSEVAYDLNNCDLLSPKNECRYQPRGEMTSCWVLTRFPLNFSLSCLACWSIMHILCKPKKDSII